jgi:17beta-estradiol 17-dehydrogenase / very-long-chain 3-oxoacyl-CoA reductase
MVWIYNAVLGLGAITATSLSLRIARFVHLYFIHKSTIGRYLHPKENAYALVTGSSDGIGLSTSRKLLECGFNVVLHGRNPEKLEKLRTQLSQDFPDRKVLAVAAPANDAVPAVAKIVSFVEKLQQSGGRLTVLVNNVGGGAVSLHFVGAQYASKHSDVILDLCRSRIDRLR